MVHGLDISLGEVAHISKIAYLSHMILDLPQILLSYDLDIPCSYEGALSRYRVDISFSLQLIIGTLGRDDTDAQVLRKNPDRRKHQAFFQITVDDLGLNLVRYLLVDRL